MRFILLTCLSLLVGCVSSDAVKIGKSTYPPRPEDWIVDVYLPTDVPVDVHKAVADAAPPGQAPRSAKVIGRIDADGAPASSWGSVIESAKKKARALGGDGLVMSRWGMPVVNVGMFGVQRGKMAELTVLRYRR